MMHCSHRKHWVPALAVLGLAVLPHNAQAQGYAFTTFDYASSYYTIANSVNNSGQIVGSYGATDGGGNQTTSGFSASAFNLSAAGLT